MNLKKLKYLICEYSEIQNYLIKNFLDVDFVAKVGNGDNTNLKMLTHLVGVYYEDGDENLISPFSKNADKFTLDGRLIIELENSQFSLSAKNLRLEHSEDNKSCYLHSASLEDYVFLILEKE